MKGSYKTRHCCWDLHHGCRRQSWDVEPSAAEALHTLFSAAIVPATGDLFHCLPSASSLTMGAKVCSLMTAPHQGYFIFRRALTLPPPTTTFTELAGRQWRHRKMCFLSRVHNVAVQASKFNQWLTSGEKCNGNDLFPSFFRSLVTGGLKSIP